MNLYAYCGNNPVMYSDPSGHSVILTAILIGAGIEALAGGIMSYQQASEVGKTDWELAGETALAP